MIPSLRLPAGAAAALLAVAAPLAASSPDSVVVFNELHYNPSGADEAGEWLELHNQMAIDVDLSGWAFDDGIGYTFPAGTVIPGGGYLVVAKTPGHVSLAGVPGVLGPFTGQLSNGGERVDLASRSGRLMDRIEYGDAGDWPVAADGTGPSLAKRDRDQASQPPANWTASAQVGGTPGAPNFARPGEVVRHTLVASDSVWRFEDSDTPQPASFTTAGFDDATWSTGTQLFGTDAVGGTPVLTITQDLVERFRAGAITGVADGGTFATWPDTATGDGVSQNATAGGNPTFRANATPSGQPAVRFDGDDEFRTTASPGIGSTAGFTYFAVVRANGAQAGGAITDGSGAYLFDRVATTGNPLASLKVVNGRFGVQKRFDSGAGLGGPLSTSGISTSDYQIVALRRNPAANRFELWVDGELEGTESDPGSPLTPQPIVIGRHGTIVSGGWNGDIAELLVYRSALSDADFQTVGSYLESAYGLDTGFGGSVINTQISDTAATSYFRSTFTFSGDPARTAVRLNHTVADGAVFYLNGIEIARANLPGGLVTHATSALSDITMPEATGFVTVSGSQLVGGTNVLAVSLHTAPGDTSATFGATLEATETPPAPDLSDALVLNEVSAADAGTFFIELRNVGTAAVSTAGYRLGAYDLPAVSVPPGGHVAYTESELGFRLASGDKAVLVAPGGTAIADAQVVTGRLRGRSDALPGQWVFPAVATPGSANVFELTDAVVINEINYNPTPLPASPGTPPTVETVGLLGFGATWRYNESGADLGPSWAAVAHPVGGGWESGPGAHAFASPAPPVPVGTLLAFPNFNNPYVVTYYFETEFALSAAEAAALETLALRHVLDDGAIIYLNGTEIFRYNLPAGSVSASTLAAEVGNSAIVGPVAVALPPGLAVAGSNRLSVEVHQSSTDSGDVVFGLEVASQVETDPGAPPLPLRNSDEQWVELFNRGNTPVDLGGWNFGDGIDYTFAAGTTLDPGGYIVVAREPAALLADFPGARVVGPFGGSLDRGGERLVLRDAANNPADIVRYYDGGRWPGTADAGGSTLELRDPDADNGIAEAWAASDEFARSGWQTYTYRGVAAPSSVGPDGQWREFVFGLHETGVMLVDDLTVTENPDGTPVAMVAGGDFESGSAGFRILGNHGGSAVVPEPGNPSNGVLRLVATGTTEHQHNHIETSLAGGRSVVNGRTYEISFRAKWISGSNQLHTRLYFNRLPRTTLVAKNEVQGTPGAPNSTAVANAGPTFTEFSHLPAVPVPGEAVTVTVRAQDPDGLGALTLFYSVGGGAFASVPMAASGQGFAASVPGASAGEVVQFYVSATDGAGATATFPAAGQDSRALFKVDDGFAATNGLHNIRIILTPADRGFLHEETNVMSNGRIGCTVIYDESQVFYDVGVRLKGSERARNQDARVGFNIGFGRDNLFRGVHRTIAIDRSEGQMVGQIESLWDQMMVASGGVPGEFNDLCQVIAPLPQHTSPAALQLARFGSVFLDSQFENGADGTVYEYELIYYPTTTAANGLKRPEPDVVIGTDIRSLGADPENYRWNYLIKNNQEADDFSRIIALAEHFDLGGAAFDDGLADVIDIDQWLRALAYSCAAGAGDSFFTNSNHNGQFYARPGDGRVLYFPHDLDFAFNATLPIFTNQELQRITAVPSRRRDYLGHLHNICTTVFNASYMGDWTDHFGSLLPGQNFAAHLSYIDTRSNYILGQINNSLAPLDFRITTNGGNSFSTGASPVALEGEGWVNVRTIRIAGSGVPLAVTWTGIDTWSLAVPLAAGANVITLEAVDFEGAVVGTDSITVTNTGSVQLPTSGTLAVSEIYYNPPGSDESTEFVEILNTSANTLDLTGLAFTGGITFAFPAGTMVAPGGRAIVVRDAAAFTVPVVGAFAGQLENGGETITLSLSDGTTVQSFAYSDDPPWPTAADGDGFSLVLVDPFSNPDHSLPQSWRASAVVGGSPGGSDTESFDAWKGRFGNPADGADDDGDGFDTRLEYFTGGDPDDPGVPGIAGRPVLAPTLDRISVVRSATAEAAVLSLESSADLGSWTAHPEAALLGNVRLPGTPARDRLDFEIVPDGAASYWRFSFGSSN